MKSKNTISDKFKHSISIYKKCTKRKGVIVEWTKVVCQIVSSVKIIAEIIRMFI
ncbi:hypothetical protein HDE70_002269 [Pedobacter cryoconitis]|nr:hypothetical protein [Pedobacter cryoconitis]